MLNNFKKVYELPEIDNLPMGQISSDECKLLYWLAKEVWNGKGTIVEVGSLYGKSTVCLGRGIRENKNEKKGKLHCFDRWMVDDENRYMMGQLKKGYNGSFKHLFDSNVNDFTDLIITHEGDAFEQEWSGEDIAILFLDCSVSKEFHEMAFNKFFKNLNIDSILIHQDYFFYRSYYLPLMMVKLSNYMSMIGNVDTSMVYQVRSKIPDKMFIKPLIDDELEIEESLLWHIKLYGGMKTQWGGIFCTMMLYYYYTKNDISKFIETTKKLMYEQKITSSTNNAVVRNLNSLMKETGKWHLPHI